MKRIYTLATLLAFLVVFPALAQAQQTQAQQAQIDLARGAVIWKETCMRCHNARSSMERNDRDWATIVAHMRARANLTRSEARAILAFLQATNAPETVPVPAPAPTHTTSSPPGQKQAPDPGGH